MSQHRKYTTSSSSSSREQQQQQRHSSSLGGAKRARSNSRDPQSKRSKDSSDYNNELKLRSDGMHGIHISSSSASQQYSQRPMESGENVLLKQLHQERKVLLQEREKFIQFTEFRYLDDACDALATITCADYRSHISPHTQTLQILLHGFNPAGQYIVTDTFNCMVHRVQFTTATIKLPSHEAAKKVTAQLHSSWASVKIIIKEQPNMLLMNAVESAAQVFRVDESIWSGLIGDPSSEDKLKCNFGGFAEDRPDWSEVVSELKLNQRQQEAVHAAGIYKMSIIKGPAGTGKSETITHIACRAADAGCRTLLVVQNNSAGKHLADILDNWKRTDVLLLVSDEYLVWHGADYKHLHSYMREIVEELEDGEVYEEEPRMLPGGWFNRAGLPNIVICTVDFFEAVMLAKHPSGERQKIKELISLDTIQVFGAEESSQLWMGHTLVFSSLLKNIKSAVLVGDEFQLSPFNPSSAGNLEVKSTSLLDLALLHKDSISTTVLTDSHRLMPVVADFLSKFVYDEPIKVCRNVAVDNEFDKTMTQIAAQLPAGSAEIDWLHVALRAHTSPSDDGAKEIVWMHVPGMQNVSKITHSSSNENEANDVAQFVRSFVAIANGLIGARPITITVLTPYLDVSALLSFSAQIHSLVVLIGPTDQQFFLIFLHSKNN